MRPLAQIYLAEAAGKEADLEHDLADGEEWSGGRSEVNYKEGQGVKLLCPYCGGAGHQPHLRFQRRRRQHNCLAPIEVHRSDVEIRLLDASFVNGEIGFLRKIRENTYKYVG